MYSRVVKADVYTDQEVVAKLISRYDFVSLPIVEQDQTLVGVVTVDDVIDIVIQEANEDIEDYLHQVKPLTFIQNL